jgi:hypothetical protein
MATSVMSSFCSADTGCHSRISVSSRSNSSESALSRLLQTTCSSLCVPKDSPDSILRLTHAIGIRQEAVPRYLRESRGTARMMTRTMSAAAATKST